ncbi:hypothetical protein ACHAXR_008798 [Thalassiosira sp. AJA248-18]
MEKENRCYLTPPVRDDDDVMRILNEVHAREYDEAKTVPEEIDIATSLVAPILKKSVQVTEIPFYVFTHLIAERMKSNVTSRSNVKHHHRLRETFMQLLQHVTICMTGYDGLRTHFCGDRHQVHLYCSTCETTLGNSGNILEVLSEARRETNDSFSLRARTRVCLQLPLS